MKNKTTNNRSRRWRGKMLEVRLDHRRKPQCFVMKVNGKLRLVGSSAAAKWMHISHATMSAIVHGRSSHFARETVDLIRKEYPELFEK